MLADTSCQAETEEGSKARHDQADRLLRDGMRGYAEDVLPKMVAPYNITALPAVADHVLAMMLRTAPEGAAAALRARATPRLHRRPRAAAHACAGRCRPGRRVDPSRRR